MSDKRHAYLIIAHHQPQLLELLCKLLDHPQHDFYIHIDAKTKDFPFDSIKQAVKYSAVHFTPRTSVNWGGYSQINCELLLLKEALKGGEYSYFHLLSGVDLPLRTAEEIYSFFCSHDGKEFINTRVGDKQRQENMRRRISHWCILQEKAGRNDKSRWYRYQDKLRHWQYTLEIDRTRKLEKTIKSGHNWFSITQKLAKYVVDNEKWIKKFFSHSICADELFLQTLIDGTEFENNLYRPLPQADFMGCMRYIDWDRGEPYTFTDADYDELMNCGYLFARKFDIEKHPGVCRRIYSTLMKNKNTEE